MHSTSGNCAKTHSQRCCCLPLDGSGRDRAGAGVLVVDTAPAGQAAGAGYRQCCPSAGTMAKHRLVAAVVVDLAHASRRPASLLLAKLLVQAIALVLLKCQRGGLTSLGGGPW